ncbi:MAG TPA: SpoIVB peptidase S55 domain-containing protein, partial [Candidatus Polarisedimenticolaceae bacterium]|nr:SpoIVB peptidase S55 domain-containing protein [Candidatus Polarisedimenticolaceae bacterium]
MTLPRRFALAPIAAILVCLTSVGHAAAPTTLPFESIRPGMKGIGRTVFQGDRIEEFSVEIVGTIPHIGPEQDLILARCSGGPLATTGIMAGMSGSPVFIDGKLIGAVAYSWGFSKEAIAGITPIGEMLAIGARGDLSGGKRRAGARVAWSEVLASTERPADLPAFFAQHLDRLGARPVSGASPALPLAVAGLGAAGIARIAPELTRGGFLPMQSSAPSAAAAAAPGALQPGSPVGVKLVRGDVDMTATGTVTWVDGDRLYAFGHPLYGLGEVDLPLTGARIETLLASLERSAKIAVPLGEAGAFRQDRASAIFGKLGASPSMIPIRLQLTDGSGTKRTYAFDVADDPMLAPILLYLSLQGVVETVERTFGAATVRLQEGSVIKVDGSEDIRLDNLFAGDGAATSACGLSAYLLYVLMNNEWADARVRGVNLLFEYDRAPRTALVRRVTLDRYRVTAGSSVTARIVVS